MAEHTFLFDIIAVAMALDRMRHLTDAGKYIASSSSRCS